MKKSKEVLVVAVAIAAALFVPKIHAQDHERKGPGPRGMPRPIEMLIEHRQDIGLTDEQVTKLKAVQDENRTKAEALRDDKSLSREQKRDKMQELMKDARTKIDGILTPEQREKAKALGGKARKEHRGPGHDAPPPPESK